MFGPEFDPAFPCLFRRITAEKCHNIKDSDIEPLDQCLQALQTRVDEINLIITKLNELGYTNVTFGDEVPLDADAVLTYRDKWMWDITMYMVELTITVRDKDSWIPLATGNSMHTSLTRKSEEEMVEEVLRNIFTKQ